MNQFVERIIDRHARLEEIYADFDGARKDELATLDGDPTSVQMFAKFYDQVKDIKDYHSRFGSSENKSHEAKILLKEGKREAVSACLAQFSPAENNGRYVDLQGLHFTFSNLKGIANSSYALDYMGFLISLDSLGFLPVPASTRKSAEYVQFLTDLTAYFKLFVAHTTPLYNLEAQMDEKKKAFEESWSNHTFVAAHPDEVESNAMDVDGTASPVDSEWPLPWQLNLEASTDFVCPSCSMKLAKDTVWKAHITSKKHEKMMAKYLEQVKTVSWLETQLQVFSEISTDALVATKENIENKQARLPGESAFMSRNGADEHEDDESDDEEEDFSQRKRMTKKNYPVGPDGNPIPYWLYRLQGLSHEFKCEICGNASYFGRKAFERHFSDSRHGYGLRCLGIENSRDYFEITEIEKALALQKHLAATRREGRWDADTMEEFEDAEGTVMDKATHDLLAKQFGM